MLWFRALLLFAVLYVCAPERPFLGLEHPADPVSWAAEGSPLQQCPSVWNFPEFQRFAAALGAWHAHFDQGALGHARRKPTTLMVTSWSVYENLDSLRGPGLGEASAQETQQGAKRGTFKSAQ